MSSHHALKKVILTIDLSMPRFVDVVAKINGVWRLIVSYLKETGGEDDGDSLGVKFSSFDCINTILFTCILYLWCLEAEDGLVFLLEPKSMAEVSFAASPWNLLVFPYCLALRLSCIRIGSENFAQRFQGTHYYFSMVIPHFFEAEIYASQKTVGDGGFCDVYDMSSCFRCQQICSLVHSSVSRESLFWKIGAFLLLLAAENQKGVFVATFGTVAGVGEPKSFSISCNWWEGLFSGTRIMTALNKVGSQIVRTEFRRDARRFLADFENCLISAVALRLLIGQGRSSFCLATMIGGDEVAPFQLLIKLLDGLLEKERTRRCEVEACRAGCQSLVQEQRQLGESPWGKGRPINLSCTGWFPCSAAPV